MNKRDTWAWDAILSSLGTDMSLQSRAARSDVMPANQKLQLKPETPICFG